MTTAVDTNILLDVIRENPRYAEQSAEWLALARSRGLVVICPIVYGELVPTVNSKSELDDTLDDLDVELSPIDDAIAYEAGLRWQQYRQAGGTRARLLPDFLIGAHALVSADTFLTRDEGFYRSYFPELQGV